MTILTLSDLGVGYRGQCILPPISFSVSEGDFWALIGPNGSGKSTVLKTVLSLLAPISGDFSWREGARIGYVPQRAALDLSIPARVIDVVCSGFDRQWSFLRPSSFLGRAEAVRSAMEDTNTTSLAYQQYVELSEGQKQRVLMARALASKPNILVLDEPTSAMDMNAERDIFELIEELRVSRTLTILLVSHHLPVIGQFASHALLVDKDCGIVLSGDIRDVASDPITLEHFGLVLRDAVCTHDEHDHQHHAHAHVGH